MSGPGWHCDGCGDYLISDDGRGSRSVAQDRLRAEVKRLRAGIEKYLADEQLDRDDPRELRDLLGSPSGSDPNG